MNIIEFKKILKLQILAEMVVLSSLINSIMKNELEIDITQILSKVV